MALRLARETPYGISLPAAYVRVVFFSGDNTHVAYQVRIWATAKARQDEKTSLDERTYSFPYVQGQGDILVQCYQHLKSLVEFSGGVDV